ncbi:MAG TPA: MBL fold metallo-hydrolase [Planctomycetota bacterium]|nr:MBL fold metallo-hydrolase [Planctomycetota bacterium]
MKRPLDVEVVVVSALAQNCSILRDPASGDAVVVDPGDDLDLVVEAIEAKRTRVVAIVGTHGHVDHVGRAAELRERLGVPIWGPQREDRFWLDALPTQGEMFGLGTFRAFVPDRWLEDGDAVEFGDASLEVAHCPGHTPGEIVLVHRPSKLVVAGDVLFAGSIGRTDFPRGDHATLLRSIREKLLSLPDDFTVLPGHGPTTTIGEERATNPFLVGEAE